MKKVLIISRYFPPAGSPGGSIRLTKLLKYGVNQNWDFVVFTEDIEKPVIIQPLNAIDLSKEIPQDTNVNRISNPLFNKKMGRQLFHRIVGDSSLPWGVKLFIAINNYLKNNNVDLIFANTPPFTNPLIGAIVGKLFDIPFIIDIKDEWVGTPSFYRKNKLRQNTERLFEKIILSAAVKVVLVTPKSLSNYFKRYPSFPSNKFKLIPNGADIEEFDQYKPKFIPKTDKFIITTIGQGFRPDYRDLTPFLMAIIKFVFDYPETKNNIEIRFVGGNPNTFYNNIIESTNLKSIIKTIPTLSRSKLVKELHNANLFFDTMPKNIPSGISGSLYEYWATASAPILLISEIGAASTLIENNHLGKHFQFDENEKIYEYIFETYTSYVNHNPVKISRKGIDIYDRKFIANQMIDLWNQMT